MRERYADRSHQHAAHANQGGGSVTKNPLAPSEQRTYTGGQQNGEQADGSGELHGQIEAKNQQRYRNHAAAGASHGKDEADADTQECSRHNEINRGKHRPLQAMRADSISSI